MYNTWDIACKIFPFWAGLMLWLIYLLFRGEKVGKELVVSTRKEFYLKCYELEKALGEKFKVVHTEQETFRNKLKSEGKWIETADKTPVLCESRENISKTENIPSQRNYMVEGYKAFRESKKEVITKPISLIPESTSSYDMELFRKSPHLEMDHN